MNNPTQTQAQVLRLLDDVLSLEGRAQHFDAATPLLGAVPELDSMAVVSLITAMEEQLGISVDDDEIDGDVFARPAQAFWSCRRGPKK
jgi:acyl carrier protein